jgi:hypothetical protein
MSIAVSKLHPPKGGGLTCEQSRSTTMVIMFIKRQMPAAVLLALSIGIAPAIAATAATPDGATNASEMRVDGPAVGSNCVIRARGARHGHPGKGPLLRRVVLATCETANVVRR